MKKFFKKYAGTIAFLTAVAVCVCFIAHAVALGTEYSRGVTERAAIRAEFYTEEISLNVKATCDNLKRETKYAAQRLSECATESELKERFKNFYLSGIASDDFLEAFYLKNGVFINANGEEIRGYDELDELKNGNGNTLSKVFQYDNRIMTVAAFQKTESDFIDGIAVLYDRFLLSLDAILKGGESDKKTVDSSEFTVLIRHDGKPIDKIENSKDFQIKNETLQSGVLKNLLSGTEIDEFVRSVASGKSVSFTIGAGSNGYVLAVNSLGAENGCLALAGLYKISSVYGAGYDLIESIWAVLLGLASVMAIMTISVIASRVYAKKRIYELEMIDSFLNCATPKKFESDAEIILKRHKSINFAMVSLKISNFGYVYEKFGDEESKNLALFASGAIKHALFIDETFAYAGDGEFLALLYYKDRKSFTDRLNGLYLRLSQYEGLKERDYKVSASFSVYEIEKEEKQTVSEMLVKLKTVKDSSGVVMGSFCVNFYEDMLREKRIRKAEIESRMESALENSEFHLFYQPKYNIRSRRTDGCEILIRWYDPKIESYRVPSVFLPVFEEDGFICKIDRFVFYKACENIAARVAQRKISYPVSVNVSRVTAIQPDFVDYYVRIKNKFNIENGFITLEFTESFAYENYGYLAEVVNKLHENGFLCAIDDFGTGYSSYNILKTISTDEIKLDKFFLEKGLSEERDRTLFKSVIEMIKKIGIKVTQEGVETREDFERLQSFGCDVIQGYFYAKPMKYVDYCEFIDKNS